MLEFSLSGKKIVAYIFYVSLLTCSQFDSCSIFNNISVSKQFNRISMLVSSNPEATVAMKPLILRRSPELSSLCVQGTVLIAHIKTF